MKNQHLNISVIGLGYIGLPTAAVLASRGHQVIGVDVNEETINTINKGEVHIVEPDLDIVVRAVVTTGHLKATLHQSQPMFSLLLSPRLLKPMAKAV